MIYDERMKSLTIQIPESLEKRLAEYSCRHGLSLADAACEIIHRRLLLNRFHELCRESESLAKAAGFQNEEQVLRAIS